jgi:6-pyruvoyl-tetrahydropterin synthase related domain
VLAGASLLAIAPFFLWGSPSGHDFEFHVFSWMEVLGQWKQGIVYPRWAALAHWGYGEARFLFYPPASWTLGAVLGAILPWKIVPGAYCWIVLTMAGAAMYRLARMWLQAPDALFAAVFYALNPYHLLVVYWRSAYAELLASALLPLVLLFLLRVYNTAADHARPDYNNFRPTLWLSVTLAAAWLTNAPAALMIQYSAAGLALLLAFREFAQTKTWSRHIWLSLVRTALAILLGAGLASFYLIPANYEQGWINLNEVLSPGVRPQDNFLFTLLADPDHNRFNLLVSSVASIEIVVLMLAIWFSRGMKPSPGDSETRNTNRVKAVQSPWLLVSAWGAASAALMVSVSDPLWQHLPKFRFVQLPFRWLLCMNAALAIAFTIAAKRWSSRLFVSAILLGAVIVAGYRFQPPWWETAGDIRDMSDAIADGSGYEGTDEYVPIGADPYELNKTLPRISDDAGAPVQNEMLEWKSTAKHFVVQASRSERLKLRLFNYPAWQVMVNGRSVQAETAPVTSLMVIRILAGTNDVRIHFQRTKDRIIGDGVSLASLIVLVVAGIKWRTRKPGREILEPVVKSI